MTKKTNAPRITRARKRTLLAFRRLLRALDAAQAARAAVPKRDSQIRKPCSL